MGSIRKCLVCGDFASGFNYNGLTCESCKVFFHRNSPKYRALFCKRSGKCAVDKLNRRDCSKCRMEKCFLVGMKRTTVEVDYTADRAIEQGIEIFLGISTLKKITKTDITKMAQYVAHFPKNREIVKLNSYELERINEANTAISVFPDERNCKIVAIIRSLDDNLELPVDSDFYVRKTINFCQNFAAFNNLNQVDQMTLLKPFFFDIMVLRIAYSVDTTSKCTTPYIISDDGTQAICFHRDFARTLSHQDLLQIGHTMTMGLHKEIENDIIIRDLLSAMCLFQNHQNIISCPEVVRYHYFLYTQILVRYLEYKCQSKKEAKRKYLRLVALLEDMHVYLGYKKRLIENFDSDQFAPIMRELYDLN